MESIIVEIEEKTNYLLAENLYSEMNPQKFVDWAVYLLMNELETENILILAGLDNCSREEIEKYFWKCVYDLKLNLKKTDFELLENYAIHLANEVIADCITPEAGLRIMNDIVRVSDYLSKYIQFYNLNEDIDCLTYNGSTLFNSFSKTDNLDEIIKEEFRLFLKTENIGLSDESRYLIFCNKCQCISKRILKPKRKWFGKIKYNYWACSICKSKDLEHFSTQHGKRVILNELYKKA